MPFWSRQQPRSGKTPPVKKRDGMALKKKQTAGGRRAASKDATAATARNGLDEDLLVVLEKSVREALKDASLTGAEKNAAATLGLRIAALKHRIAGPPDDGDFFGS